MSPTSVPSRVLVRAPNWLGDAVLALPAIGALRRHFADASLTVAGPPAVAALFGEETDASPDDVIELAEDGRAATAAIRSGRFDLGVLLPNSFHAAWQLRRAGVAERWGFPTAGRAWLLTRRSRRSTSAETRHHSDYFRQLVRGLDIACDDRPPRVVATAAAREAAARLFERAGLAAATKIVGLAPGAAYGQAKQWPPDRVAALAARLVGERDCTCLVLGAAHDQTAARAIESWLRAHAPETVARVVNLAGRTSLRVLAGVVARCDAVVSNDSGSMHLAAAIGRPVAAIFGPTDERATRPIGDHDVIAASVFCRPCLLRDCPIDHRCMTRISVDRVFDLVAARLDRAARRPGIG